MADLATENNIGLYGKRAEYHSILESPMRPILALQKNAIPGLASRGAASYQHSLERHNLHIEPMCLGVPNYAMTL